MSVTPSASRNATIDGLRGFSATLVVLAHIFNISVLSGFVAGPLWNIGTFGVYLFFLISGYLIVQSLARHADVGVFLKNRAVRIYPVFTVLTLVMFAIGPPAHYSWMGGLRHSPLLFAKSFLANMLFLPGMFDLPIVQKNAWSLSYEFAFYLTASLFYVASVQMGRRKPLAILLWVAGFGVSLEIIRLHPAASLFLVGVILFLLRDRINARVGMTPGRGVLGLLYLTICYVTADRSWPVFWAFGFLFFLSVVNQQGYFSAFLRSPLWQYLGKISYSLYLIHPFALEAVRIGVRHLHQHLHNGYLCLGLFVATGVPLAVYAASLSFHWIETRLTAKLFGRTPRTKPHPVLRDFGYNDRNTGYNPL